MRRGAVVLSVVSLFSTSVAGELGLGLGVTYLEEEERLAPSLHLHYKEHFKNYLGFGIGLEHVLGDHGHSIASLILSYEAYEHVSLNYMPGLDIEEKEIVHHFELSFGFESNGLHLGPFLGVSLGNESHLSAGVHFAF